jgi:hypothetical protein
LKALVMTVALAVSISGCSAFGEANSHNTKPAPYDIRLVWTRVDDPANYPTIMHACDGTTGLYVVDSGTGITVVTDDKLCAPQNAV